MRPASLLQRLLRAGAGLEDPAGFYSPGTYAAIASRFSVRPRNRLSIGMTIALGQECVSDALGFADTITL
jgi:hypothetical protein